MQSLGFSFLLCDWFGLRFAASDFVQVGSERLSEDLGFDAFERGR